MPELIDIYHEGHTASDLADLHDLVQPVLAELGQALGYERTFIVLMNADRGGVRGVIGEDAPEGIVEAIEVGLDESGPVLSSLRLGRPLRVDDALRDPRVPETMGAFYASCDMASFAAIPLLPASGVLLVSKRRPISEAEIIELLPYAGRLAVMMSDRTEAARQRESGEQHMIQEEWLWWMVNAVPDPMVLSDEQNVILLTNQRAERLLTPRPEDSEGKRYAISMNNFLLSTALSSFALDQGAAPRPEVTLVDPIEGTELLFEVICQPATNLRTGRRGLVSVLRDVTGLRMLLEELQRTLRDREMAGETARRERDRVNLILAYVADPIVVTDPSGEIIRMNQPAERLLQAPDTLLDERRTIYQSNDAKVSSFLSQLRLDPAEARHGEIALVDPETLEPLTMSITATEVRDELGQVTTVVSVLHDLTKIRELERRTVEQQLFDSEKLAAVGRLAAAVAHEINNPLEAIKNALYLLVSRTPVDDPNRRFLEIAEKETGRVSGIIQQMLGFYRPGAAMVPTDVNAAIDEAITLLERHLRQRGIMLRHDIDRSLPPVYASADQLKQVFLNLILNARDAMPEGGTLHVSTRLSRQEDRELVLDGSWVLIQFQDTGAGISEEHLRHIFEPFFTTKQEQRGTGLGLWVSMNIIQQHGGQMKVRSRPGRGTTFTIALPLGGHDG